MPENTGKTSTPIRIDADVHEWIMTIKEAFGHNSASSVLREALREVYPNIEEIVAAVHARTAEAEAEKQAVLKTLRKRE